MLTSASECILWLSFWPSCLPVWSGLCPQSSQISLSLISTLQRSSLAFFQWNDTTNCGNQSLIVCVFCVCMFACAHVCELHASACLKDVCGLISSFPFQWINVMVHRNKGVASLCFVLDAWYPVIMFPARFQCPTFVTMIKCISKVVCMKQHCQPVRAHK